QIKRVGARPRQGNQQHPEQPGATRTCPGRRRQSNASIGGAMTTGGGVTVSSSPHPAVAIVAVLRVSLAMGSRLASRDARSIELIEVGFEWFHGSPVCSKVALPTA